jgi:hypothetical protein
VSFRTIAIGLLLLVAGLLLLFNVGGAASALIRRVTSRSLGSLAPGYAADPWGMRVYAILVAGLGLAVTGVGLAPSSVLVGAAMLALGVTDFVIASVLIIAGEVRTYRALPRPPTR